MTNYSRTTLRELKKRYLNILKKCLLANLMAFSFVLPSMAEETWNEIELTTQIKTQADVDALNLGGGNTKVVYTYPSGNKYPETNEFHFIQVNDNSLIFDGGKNSIVFEDGSSINSSYPYFILLDNSTIEFKNINNITKINTSTIEMNTSGKVIFDISGDYISRNNILNYYTSDLFAKKGTSGYIFANNIDIQVTMNPLYTHFGSLYAIAKENITLEAIGAGAAIFSAGGKTYLQGKNMVLKAKNRVLQVPVGYALLGGYIDEQTGEKIITPAENILVESTLAEKKETGVTGDQGAIHIWNGGSAEIYAKNIELNAYNKDSQIEAVAVTGGRENASKLLVNATENLTVHGGVGAEYGSQDTGPTNLITLNSNSGKMLITGNVKSFSQESLGFTDKIELLSSKGGTIEIQGKILNEKDAVAVANETSEGSETGVFVSLDGSTLKLHKESDIEKITSNNGVVDLTNTTSESVVQIASLEGEGTNILVDSSDTAKTTVHMNNAKRLTVEGTSQMNDEVNDQHILTSTLASLVEIEDGNKEVQLFAEEGKIAGRLEAVVLNGDVSKLRASKNSVTESVKDVMGLQVLSFRNQINDVQKRMGDLRLDENLKGTWVRTFGGDVKFGDMGLKNKYNTIQAGADFKKGNAYFGIMASLTEGESDMDRGTGEDKTYGMGVYAGYMTDNGWYVDATAKQMHLQNKFKARYNTGELSRGSYKTWGTSVSLEAGKRMNLPCGFFVEPQAEIMYGRVQGIDYTTSAGVKVEQEAFESLIGRAGLSVGKTFKDKGSVYANVSVLNDFAGKVKTTFSYWNQETKTRDDMGGAWTEFAVGGTYKLNKNTAVYGEFATSKGTDLTNPVQWSLGLRFSF